MHRVRRAYLLHHSAFPLAENSHLAPSSWDGGDISATISAPRALKALGGVLKRQRHLEHQQEDLAGHLCFVAAGAASNDDVRFRLSEREGGVESLRSHVRANMGSLERYENIDS